MVARAEVAARKFLEYLIGQGLAFPTSMVDVCRFLKFTLKFAPLDPYDGCYIRNKNNKRLIIIINSKRSAYRQLFSIAHELGHIILRHPPILFMEPGKTQQSWYETQANVFAAELLMPKNILKPLGPMTATELARYCHVSMTAATIRVKQLGWMQ
jgi:Zn-dependent peptidase ImmA (M78 family)